MCVICFVASLKNGQVPLICRVRLKETRMKKTKAKRRGMAPPRPIVVRAGMGRDDVGWLDAEIEILENAERHLRCEVNTLDKRLRSKTAEVHDRYHQNLRLYKLVAQKEQIAERLSDKVNERRAIREQMRSMRNK